MNRATLLVISCAALLRVSPAQQLPPLPGTIPLTLQGDLSQQMVAGMGRFLNREMARAQLERQRYWRRDFSSRQGYENSIATNREDLRRIIGAVDGRVPLQELEMAATSGHGPVVAETDSFTAYAVRWPVLPGVYGEGLWLRPKASVLARVIAIPDADQTPETISGLEPGLPPERQFARRLAELRCEVLVPVLINREDVFSGNASLDRITNQPHREWIYRQAYELGRHIIGYEVQKILGAVDFLKLEGGMDAKIGIVGYAEGGLIGFYAAALDPRVDSALVSGYFDSRQRLWEEPIYRNLFGLLREFGDAEIATLLAPRNLVIEHSPVPRVDGPPKPGENRSGAAPGRLTTPDYESVENEFERARSLLKPAGSDQFNCLTLISGTEGMTTGPMSDRALSAFLSGLGIAAVKSQPLEKSEPVPMWKVDSTGRQERQVRELEDYTQRVFRESEQVREELFWKKLKVSSAEEWAMARAPFQRALRDEVIGSFGPPALPVNPQARKIIEKTKWTGFEVVLDVYPDVFAWGYLLVPKDIKPSQRRPAVVCQHGLEGLPDDVINEDKSSRAFSYYKAFAPRLAERGFVVFVPHNPYRGGDKFRQLQRQANPLGASLFSFVVAQHSQILDWLSNLPFVDGTRIGFYGLSYGGKTAMRVPAILDKYALSICSGDFNEWVRKNVSVDSRVSYLFTGEYEMPEWDLGHTFNYAEMAALIAPRPFMVERGHSDTVGLDEWIAYEYAKVRRLYDRLGIPDRTAIEFFNGPHTIDGVGTFEFLHHHLNWPQPQE